MKDETLLSSKKLTLFFGGIFLLSFLLHLGSSGMLGYHRDEFLYLALGQHPGLGHWSNPPFIGWISYLTQQLFDGSLRAIHIFPAIAGGLMSLLSCLIARELGGRRFAIVLTAVATFFHLAYLRAFSFLMPVPFDILFWTLFVYLIIRYLNTDNSNYLYALGAAIGLGMLNKYSVFFFALALILGTLLTPHRKLLFRKEPYLAMGLGFLIFLPNLYWQYCYGFPVIHHMAELSESQLQNVLAINFISDQFLMNAQNVLLVLPGLFFLLFSKTERRFRLPGWIAFLSILLFLVFKGKSYYTLGVFPPLIAAGAVFWEQKVHSKVLRIGFTTVIIAATFPLLPMSLPLYPSSHLEVYFRKYQLEGVLRWEDGRVHSLPQDYADMLGWQDIAKAADKAYELCDPQKPVIVYGENYGQAGAVEHLGKNQQMPAVNSFSDSYVLWHPEKVEEEVEQFIYINDELGADVEALFADIRVVDSVRNSRAREYGTKIYLCRQPRRSFTDFWNSRVEYVRKESGLK